MAVKLNGLPGKQALYDPQFETDACGVGFVVNIDGIRSQKVSQLNPSQPCKGKSLDTCYSAAYMRQTRDQQRFTMSEVAADWCEPMVPQRIMWPSISAVWTDKLVMGRPQIDSQCQIEI